MFEINGILWQVVIVSPNHSALIQPNGEKAVGCCDRVEKRIYISKEVFQTSLFKTVLCHEVVHAIVYSYDIDLSVKEEESLASFISIFFDEIYNIVDNFI